MAAMMMIYLSYSLAHDYNILDAIGVTTTTGRQL